MTDDAADARKAFVQQLGSLAIVEEIDWTRDCYQTVVLELGDPAGELPELAECINCGAVGLKERIHGDGHDCRDFLQGGRDA